MPNLYYMVILGEHGAQLFPMKRLFHAVDSSTHVNTTQWHFEYFRISVRKKINVNIMVKYLSGV